MAQHENVEGDMTHPAYWPEMEASMNGFPFPELTFSRELRRERPGREPLDAIELTDGTIYVIERELHKSLFGSVYHGTRRPPPDQPQPGRLDPPRTQQRPMAVAVKASALIRMRKFLLENSFREVAVMRHMIGKGGDNHIGRQCIMPLLDACLSRTHLYVITPLCEGGDLLSHVEGGFGLKERTMRIWFQQILLGLAFIHSKGLCHHDLSPENIVVTGDSRVAVVMDFGMAQRITVDAEGEAVLVRDERPFGKPRYMAPEIFGNLEYDGRQTDIWSVATTLLLCFTGEYAWPVPVSLPLASRGIEWSDIGHYVDLQRYGVQWMLRGMCSSRQLSAEAVDLLCSMLVIDRNDRPSSAEALSRHAFFTAPPTGG